jgi:hypothetical protein
MNKRPKFKKDDSVIYINSFNEPVKAKFICYVSKTWVSVAIPISKITITLRESELWLEKDFEAVPKQPVKRTSRKSQKTG